MGVRRLMPHHLNLGKNRFEFRNTATSRGFLPPAYGWLSTVICVFCGNWRAAWERVRTDTRLADNGGKTGIKCPF